MNKENRTLVKFGQAPVRITRSQAKALGTSRELAASKPLIKRDEKQGHRPKLKRVASDENKPAWNAGARPQHKKRAVLGDVTNIFSDNSHPNKQAKKGPLKKSAKVAPVALAGYPQVQEDAKAMAADGTSKILQEISSKVKLEESLTTQQIKHSTIGDCHAADLTLVKQTSSSHARLQVPSKNEGGKVCDSLEASNGLSIANIDSNHKDPQMCSLYAPYIFDNLFVMELDRRPSVNYMASPHKDVTESMRGILIDWIVEVSEEYGLVPDTLYLTVNLIDRFLSQNYIERQRLQLLGVTCMLIASKYEEICAPRVKEFCFITDNTYTREEVLKMESQVLNILCFQLSVPTPKKFLRRFIHAAYFSSKVPSVEMEFLANYLAELTLVDYSFLKFLPSVIAASAVFLARWTLDQSCHPWNPILEHYTRYKTSDLKGAIVALQDLQFNAPTCSLNAIRQKYKHQKFKSVATLPSPKPVQSLF